jgi:hypothetical protein
VHIYEDMCVACLLGPVDDASLRRGRGMHEVFQLLPRPLDSTASASTECQQILCTARKMKVSADAAW